MIFDSPAPNITTEGAARLGDLLVALDRLEPLLALPLHPQAADPPLAFGRYRLRARLGAGAHGVAILAHDPRLGREVVVKVPQPAVLTDPAARDRFLREARAAGGLHHPGVVAVLEAGEEDGLPYLVVGYVPGPTLAGWLREHRPPVAPGDAAQFVADAAAAVHHAHERGVLHCDLTPSNILLAPGPTGDAGSLTQFVPALTDFGLARMAPDGVALTRTFCVAGTPLYMSPEQARGDRRNLTARTDVYALGAILYELLTGRTPFCGETAGEVLAQLQVRDPRDPRAVNPTVPRDLAAVCLKCLAKDPGARYSSAAELADDLDRFRSGLPVRARPPGPVRQVWTWARRRPESAGLVVLLLLLGVVTALSSAREWQRVRAHNAELTGALGREHEEARLRRAALDRERALASRLRAHGYAATLATAGDLFATGRSDQLRPILAELRPGRDEEDLREFTWHYLSRLAPERLSLRGHRTSVSEVAVAPDGRRYASVSTDGEVILWEPAAGLAGKSLGRFPDCLSFELTFSPDGRRLAAVATRRGEARVRVWEVPTGLSVGERVERCDHCLAPAFSPEGAALRYLRRSAAVLEVLRWDVTGGAPEVLRTEPVGAGVAAHFDPARSAWVVARGSIDGTGRPSSVERWALDTKAREVVVRPNGVVCRVVPSPDGTLLGVATQGHPFQVVDARTGRERFRGSEESGGIAGAAFSADGKTLAVKITHRANFVEVWDVPTGRVRAVLRPPAPAAALCFAPDGALVIGSHDGTVGFWDVNAPPPSRELGAHPEVWAVCFAPDGKAVASAADDGMIRVWEADGRGERSALAGHASLVTALEYLPDGKSLVSGGYDGTVRVWDPATGAGHVLYPQHSAPVTGIAVSPDGRVAVSRGRDEVVRVWDLAARRHLRDLPGNRGMNGAVTFSPDGRVLAVAAGGEGMKFWDVATGSEMGEVDDLDHTWSVAFSPDGRTMATGHSNGIVRLWDVDAREPRATLIGHEGGVRSVAFSPDGRTLATGSDDATVRLWHVPSGRALIVLRGHRSKVFSVRFSPDGRSLATGSHDGTVRLW